MPLFCLSDEIRWVPGPTIVHIAQEVHAPASKMLTQPGIVQAYSDWVIGVTLTFISFKEGDNKSRGRGKMRLIISIDGTYTKREGNRI